MHFTTNEQQPRQVAFSAGATTVEAAGNILETAATPTGSAIVPMLTNGGSEFSMTLDSTNAGSVANVTVNVLTQATPDAAWFVAFTYVHAIGVIVQTDLTLRAWALRVQLVPAAQTTLGSIALRVARPN